MIADKDKEHMEGAASTDENENRLSPSTIVYGDPLLRWLSASKVSPLLIGFVYTVLLNILRGFAAWKAGYLHTVGSVDGFFEDPSVYTNFFSGMIVFAYYVWIPRGICTVFNGLNDNQVVTRVNEEVVKKKKLKPEYNYTEFINNVTSWFGKWWWSAISLIISATITLTMILPQYISMGDSAWWTAHIFPMITALIWIFIGIYCVLMLLFFTVLSIYWLHKLFKNFSISIRPLYPDRAGGLEPLGKFTLRLSYFIALLGAILITTAMTRSYVTYGTFSFRWTTELLAGLAVYGVTAPIVFFGPLSVAHDAMKKAKYQQLLNISRQFDKTYHQIQNDLETDPKKLKEHSEIITELQNFYDLTNKFPVWPFNLQNITRFFTVYLFPAVASVGVPLLDWIISKI